jgi:hypothetical protein
MSNGTYIYSDSTYLIAGKTYSLSFSYLSKEVTAKTLMPAKQVHFATQHTTVSYSNSAGRNASPDTLNKFTWDNPDSLNHVLVFNNVDDNFFPLEGVIARNGASNIFERNTDKKSVYYIVSNSFPYYGNYQVVLLSVNQEYIDLLKSNTLGSNSQNLLNMPTNIVNGLGVLRLCRQIH